MRSCDYYSDMDTRERMFIGGMATGMMGMMNEIDHLEKEKKKLETELSESKKKKDSFF